MVLLEIDKSHTNLLASIRNWESVKIAYAENSAWLRDFTAEQLQSPALLQIPHLVFYEVRDNLLFPKGSLLPARKMPSALLWSSISRALPIELPSLNHNYFGISDKVKVRIVKSDAEHTAVGLYLETATLRDYSVTAPEVRLSPLQWTIINGKSFVYGTPLLPLKATAFWQRGNDLIPVGFDLEWPVLSAAISKKINPDGIHFIIWNSDGTYISIPKESFMPLAISSIRLTL